MSAPDNVRSILRALAFDWITVIASTSPNLDKIAMRVRANPSYTGLEGFAAVDQERCGSM
jgi:hypothetical protein